MKMSRKQAFHVLFLIISAGVDLSERIYLKLNYFKKNYKTLFSELFEEKGDQSTKHSSTIDVPKNQYIKVIFDWLSGLFGEIEPEVSLAYSQSPKSLVYSKSIISAYDTIVDNYFVFVSINLLFLLYFYFT